MPGCDVLVLLILYAGGGLVAACRMRVCSPACILGCGGGLVAYALLLAVTPCGIRVYIAVTPARMRVGGLLLL